MTSSPAVDDRSRDWSEGLRRELAARLPEAVAGAAWVTGSVGRGEAVPGSDLESLAVVAHPDPDPDPDAATADPAAVRDAVAAADLSGPPWFAETSAASAADPRLVRTADDWRAAALDWATAPARDLGVVHLGLLADARPLVPGRGAGPGPDDEVLLPRLAAAAVSAHRAVLSDVLADALHVRAAVPNRLASALRSDPVVDLKAAALTPVVKLARWAALRAGVTETSTDARLAAAADPRVLPDDRWESLRTAARTVARIRWDARLRAVDPSGPGTDAIPLSTLTTAERAAFRSAVREIAGAQRTLDYLRTSGALREEA